MEISVNNSIPWIRLCREAPYFEDENGIDWCPIGQNDAVLWPELKGLFLRKNPAETEAYFAYLSANGVSCMRLMMEYCQTEHRYLEKPVGRFQPGMVQFWDDIFLLCRRYNIRVLLTPFDTFWMAKRWKLHPYNSLNGGPCNSKFKWLTSPKMLAAIKNRFDFFIERWGADGTIFAWDLWNEINPLNAGRQTVQMVEFVEKISAHIRQKEHALYKKSHLQTVSVFAPLLKRHQMGGLVFQHPMLDFSTTHFYDSSAMDNPKNAYDPAVSTGYMVKEALLDLAENRPFLDSEHGPIIYFRKQRKGLPENLDEDYFRNIQWAHFASGAAGGGMRWPYRHPHELTHVMRLAQKNLSEFTGFIDWKSFNRKNFNDCLSINGETVYLFGCGNENQAVVWLMAYPKKKKVKIEAALSSVIFLPGLGQGNFQIYFWDTKKGLLRTEIISNLAGDLPVDIAIMEGNLAIAVRRVST